MAQLLLVPTELMAAQQAMEVLMQLTGHSAAAHHFIIMLIMGRCFKTDVLTLFLSMPADS